MSLLSPTLNLPWTDVTTTKGEKIQAVGALQWWQQESGGGHVKGSLKLQRRTYSTGVSAWGGISFRLSYDGHLAGEPDKATLGALNLPSDVGWKVLATKVKSQNARARIVTITFPSNKQEISKLKITIPFEGSGEAEKLIGEALTFADQQCRSAIAANTPKTPKTPKQKNTRKKTPSHTSYTSKEASEDTPQKVSAKKTTPHQTKAPAKTATKVKKVAKRKLPKRGTY